MFAQDRQDVEQQVAEIAGVERLQPVLINSVKLSAFAVCKPLALSGVNVCRGQTLILPLIDQPAKRARRPAFLIELCQTDHLFEQPSLIVRVKDCEIALKPDQLGVPSQHFRSDRVESAEPGHPFHRVADDPPDPLFHLPRGLVGKGDGQDLRRPGAPRRDDMGEARGEGGGLACAGPCKHQHRAFGRQHSLPLGRV